MESRPLLSTLIAALLIAIAAYASLAAPSGHAPHNMLITIGAAELLCKIGLCGIPNHLAWTVFTIAPVAVLFVSWCWFLILGQRGIPLRSLVLFGGIALTSITFNGSAWLSETKHASPDFIYTMLLCNIALVAFAILLLLDNLKRSAYRSNVLFHTVLFVWIAFCAYPDFGPYPLADVAGIQEHAAH
jgi:hypothetical protein